MLMLDTHPALQNCSCSLGYEGDAVLGCTPILCPAGQVLEGSTCIYALYNNFTGEDAEAVCRRTGLCDPLIGNTRPEIG